MNATPTTLIDCTVRIATAYAAHNHLPLADVPRLLGAVHGGLAALGQAGPAAEPALSVEKPSAAQIRESVGQDGIVSFIDGRSYKTLKRHLTAHGLTPERYRERYALPADYPMTAPGYAAQRSALAKAIGLGVPGARAERVAA